MGQAGDRHRQQPDGRPDARLRERQGLRQEHGRHAEEPVQDADPQADHSADRAERGRLADVAAGAGDGWHGRGNDRRSSGRRKQHRRRGQPAGQRWQHRGPVRCGRRRRGAHGRRRLADGRHDADRVAHRGRLADRHGHTRRHDVRPGDGRRCAGAVRARCAGAELDLRQEARRAEAGRVVLNDWRAALHASRRRHRGGPTGSVRAGVNLGAGRNARRIVRRPVAGPGVRFRPARHRRQPDCLIPARLHRAQHLRQHGRARHRARRRCAAGRARRRDRQANPGGAEGVEPACVGARLHCWRRSGDGHVRKHGFDHPTGQGYCGR